MSKNTASIIMPVYNGEKYVRSCIDSIINQTYRDFELVIVDDGSSDNTVDVIREFTNIDKRIHLIKNKHEGVSVARETALNNSSGDYIAFVDADDYLSDIYLERLVQLEKESNADVACVDCEKFSEELPIVDNVSEGTKLIYHMENYDELYSCYKNGSFLSSIVLLFGKKVLAYGKK